MKYRGIVISGTSGSGKSSLSEKLSRTGNGFSVVRAVTTRVSREDDRPGRYDYLSEEEFTSLKTSNGLAVDASYRQARYGIRQTDIDRVEREGRVPILILTPESACRFAGIRDEQGLASNMRPPRFMTVFLDAPDSILDDRLQKRGTNVDKSSHEQRSGDRAFKDSFMYCLENSDLGSCSDLVETLWDCAEAGGVLSGRIISLMLKCNILLHNAEPQNVSGASYDLRLGDEYFYGGRICTLSDAEPILMIEPYDYAIVTSCEAAAFPRDICGRFDLSVSLFCQGIILSNGPQVDPGFEGPLFCLLFNTSSRPVLLKRGQHYATLEPHRMVEPTFSYRGSYQKKRLIDYLPSNAAQGAVNQLKKEVEELRKESRLLQTTSWAVLTLILALLAVWVSLK